MTLTTLYEHEFCPFDWTDRDLKMLERVNRDGSDILRPVVQQTRRGLKAAQFVGVVRFGEHTFEILPKMHRRYNAVTDDDTKTSGGNNRKSREAATRNLLYFLSYAEDLDIRAEDYSLPITSRSSDWLELLTRLFATRLREVWRRGALRRYQTRDEELPMLRGRLRVVDQLRRPDRPYRFAVTTDNLTHDNAMNRLLRFVVERLWLITRDIENRTLLGELRERMDGVMLPPAASTADCERLILSRLECDYIPLLNLARLFVNGGALQLTAGDMATCAFVFDMNVLFEAFVVGFIRRNRDTLLTGELRACTLQPQAVGSPLHLAHNDGKELFELKTDLVFRSGERFPLLLDAKYKRLDPADSKYGIAEADFYQMHAYAARCRSPHVLLIYPQTADMSAPLHRKFHLHSDTEHTITAATIDLRADFSDPVERRVLEARFRELLALSDESTRSARHSKLAEETTLP